MENLSLVSLPYDRGKCHRFFWSQVNAQHGTRTTEEVQSFNDINTWKAFKESIPQDVTKAMYTGNQLFEHLTTTTDETDYLWYIVG
jgi:hypothetical protein